MTVSSRATQRSHFARFRAELAFATPWIGDGIRHLGTDALEARRLHLRATLLRPSRVSRTHPVH